MKSAYALTAALVLVFAACGSGSDSNDLGALDISYDSNGQDIPAADSSTDGAADVPADGAVDTTVRPDTEECVPYTTNYGFRDLCDGTVLDTTTGLIWQKGFGDSGSTVLSIKGYCEKLKLGSKDGPEVMYDDWRTPSVDELRTLIVGCPATVFGGSCKISQTCWAEECTGTPDYNVPGCKCANQGGPTPLPDDNPNDEFPPDRCYLDASFEPWCQLYWSYTKAQKQVGQPDRLYYVTFYDGAVKTVNPGSPITSQYVKCVRGQAKMTVPCWDTRVSGCTPQ